jgi:hypothetical protein
LSKDYERLPKSSEAMIYLSMTRLMLRGLVYSLIGHRIGVSDCVKMS